MTVAAILAEKGREVVTVSEHVTLAEVVRCLAERQIGAVVVTRGEGQIAGIVSERDVIHALAKHGAKALEQPARNVMTREVTTCTENCTVLQLMQAMTAGRFRHVPVIRDGRLAGIVSIGDVVKRRIAEVEHDAEELRSYILTA